MLLDFQDEHIYYFIITMDKTQHNEPDLKYIMKGKLFKDYRYLSNFKMIQMLYDYNSEYDKKLGHVLCRYK